MKHFRMTMMMATSAMALATLAGHATAQCNTWVATGGLAGLGGNASAARAAVTWDPDGAGPQPSVLVVSSSGGATTVAGSEVTAFVQKWDGVQWSPMGSAIQGPSVTQLIIAPNGDLVAGGEFSIANRKANVARWNGTDWETLGTGLNFGSVAPGDGSWVTQLEIFQGSLYAAGVFLRTPTSAGPLADRVVNRLARWDGSEWQAVLGNTTTSGGGTVETSGFEQAATPWGMTVHNGELVIVGNFNSVDTGGFISAPRVARFNGTRWATFGTGIPTTGTPFAVTSFNGDLIVGGQFSTTNGAQGARIVRWNGTTWSQMGAAGLPHSVRTLHVHNGELYAGISESSPNVPSYLYRWNGTDWVALMPRENTVNDGLGINVSALASVDGGLAVMGTFQAVQNVPANNIAILNTSGAFLPLGTGTNSQVRSVTPFAGGFVAGGFFTSIDGVPANRVAFFNGSSWQPLGAGITGANSTTVFPNVGVYAVEAFGDSVFVGGDFTTAGGIPAPGIARWNGTSWQAPSTGGGRIRDLHVHNGELYAGGNGFVQKWNGTGWVGVGGAFTNSSNNPQVFRLETFQNTLYASGNFNSVGGVTINRIARFNGTAWEPLPGGGYTTGTPDAQAMVVFEDKLIIGSGASAMGPLTNARGIASFDGNNWSLMGTRLNSFAIPAIRSLHVYDGKLIAAGSLAFDGDGIVDPFTGIAQWDGTDWIPFAGSIEGAPFNMITYQGDLLAAGQIYTVGGDSVTPRIAAPFLARFRGAPSPACGPTCDPIDFNGDGLFPDDNDLVDFLVVLAGGDCSTGTCNDIDFNNDDLFPDDSDLIAFLRVLAGGNCAE